MSHDEVLDSPSGHPEGFEESFGRLAVLAHRVAFGIVGTRGDAEDVAAETLARAQVRWNQVRDHQDGWVATVAWRLAVQQIRRRQRPLPWIGTRQSSPGEEAWADRVAVVAALRDLPGRQRQALVLRYWADLTDSDTARALGCSVSAVRTHTQRGLDRLRQVLGESQEWLP